MNCWTKYLYIKMLISDFFIEFSRNNICIYKIYNFRNLNFNDAIFNLISVVIGKFVQSDVIHKNGRVTKYDPLLLEHPVHILN